MTDDPLLGTTIDRRYRLQELLGTGGMGSVYRAEHLFVHDQVAVKLLNPLYTEDEQVRERFLREPQLAAATRHPHIIPIRDAGEDEGHPYLVMEYVAGGDLAQLLAREGPLEPSPALALLAQLSAALDAAHARGLVHRDVKPANILLSAEGHAYLSDFGVAKDLALAQALTSKELFIGTVDFAAPEQIRKQPLEARTDVYAFGCLLYYCMTGEPPFAGETDYDVMEAHVREPPPRPSARLPALPPALDAVVAKAMAKAIEERYGSCGELVAAAQAALEEGAATAGESVLERAVAETELVPAVQPEPEPTPAATELDRPGRAEAEAPAAETETMLEPTEPAVPEATEPTAAGPKRFLRRRLMVGAAAVALLGGAAAVAAVLLKGRSDTIAHLLGARCSPRQVSGYVGSALTHDLLGSVSITVRGKAVWNGDGELHLMSGVCPGDTLLISSPRFRTARVTVPRNRRVEVALHAPRAVRDTFSSKARSWFTPEPDPTVRAWFETGEFRVAIKSNYAGLARLSYFNPEDPNGDTPGPPTSAVLATDAYNADVPNGDFGLECSASHGEYADSYGEYDFTLDTINGLFFLTKWVKNRSTLLRSGYSTVIHKGVATNHLQASCLGGQNGGPVRLSLVVNGTHLTSATDLHGFPMTDFGVLVHGIECCRTEIHFDNFVFQRR